MDVVHSLKQPIRVLQIVSGIDIGRLSGGAEYFALRLALNLDPTNFLSAVFSLSTNNGASEASWRDQLERQQIPLYDSKSDDVSTLSRTAALHKSYQKCLDSFYPHIVTSHSERADLLNIAGKLFHPTHPRSVRTVHIDQQWKTVELLDLQWLRRQCPQLRRGHWPMRKEQIAPTLPPTPRAWRQRPRSVFDGAERWVHSPIIPVLPGAAKQPETKRVCSKLVCIARTDRPN